MLKTKSIASLGLELEVDVIGASLEIASAVARCRAGEIESCELIVVVNRDGVRGVHGRDYKSRTRLIRAVAVLAKASGE